MLPSTLASTFDHSFKCVTDQHGRTTMANQASRQADCKRSGQMGLFSMDKIFSISNDSTEFLNFGNQLITLLLNCQILLSSQIGLICQDNSRDLVNDAIQSIGSNKSWQFTSRKKESTERIRQIHNPQLNILALTHPWSRLWHWKPWPLQRAKGKNRMRASESRHECAFL